MPNPSDMIEHGASWAAIDAVLQTGGAGIRAIKGLLEKNIEAGANPYELINKISRGLEENGVNLEKIEDVSESVFSTLRKETELAEEIAANSQVKGQKLRDRKVEKKFWDDIKTEVPEEIEAPSLKSKLKDIEREKVSTEQLDQIAERAESSQDLGESVQSDIKRRVKAAKDEYKPRYDLVAEATTEMTPNANSVVRKAYDKFDKIRGTFRTTPEDYSKTLGIVENLMRDLGGIFEVSQNGTIKSLTATNPITFEKLMELGRRSGSLAKYGNINPAIRDIVKDVNQQIKSMIREELKPQPELYKMWTEAEKIFMEKAKTFDNPIIKKIRNPNFKTEDISKMIKKPSDLQKVKEAVSPQQYKEIQRELLEEMNGMKSDKAEKFYREMKRHLDEDSRKLADEIILSKKPIDKMTSMDKNKELERWVTNKINQPAKSRDLAGMWNDKAGNARIREAIKDNPNKKEIIEYLQNQKIQSASKKWVNDSGKLSAREIKDWLSNPQNRKAIEDVAGKDGLKFIDDVANFQKKSSQRLKVYNKLKDKPLKEFTPPSKRGDEIIEKFKTKVEKEKYPFATKAQDLWDNLGEGAKDIITLFGLFKFGVYKTLMGRKAAPILLRIAKNPRLRNVFRKAMDSKNSNPWVIYGLWKNLDIENED